MEEYLAAYRNYHRDDSNDDLVPALETAVWASASHIRSYSKKPRGPRGPFSSVPHPQRSDDCGEKPQIMQDAGLALSWHNNLKLSEAQDLADDLDKILETEIQVNALADSEYGGQSTLSGTLARTYTGAIDNPMRQIGRFSLSSYDDAFTHFKLERATETTTSSDSGSTTHARTLNIKVRLHRLQHLKTGTSYRATPPQAEQQGSANTSRVAPPPSSGRPSSWLRSLPDRQTYFRSNMIIYYLLVILVIPAQMFSAGGLTRIKITQRHAESACTASNGVFASLLEFLLVILYNIGPLALLIARIVRERNRTLYKGYLSWFTCMLIFYVGILTASIVLQIRGKWEYAMLFIGISDSWFVATIFFFFEYVLRPSIGPDDKDPGDGA
jgi:hypothetical protein